MTYRASSVQATLVVLSAGIVLLVLGIGPRVEPTAASTLSWVAIVGGVGLILFALVAIGVALGRNEKPTCPHCNKPVEVNVGTWSGRIQLDKRGAT
jgi:hypothetical protein